MLRSVIFFEVGFDFQDVGVAFLKKWWDRKPVSVLIRHLSSQPTP